MTQKSLGDVLRAVDALPEDRLEWAPSDTSRSVLSQMQEIAISASWFLAFIERKRAPSGEDHEVKKSQMNGAPTTIDACKELAQASTAALCEAISDFPDEALEDEVTLPFGGGLTCTMADVLGLQAWNLTYHLGQINYLQTMLGDRVMH